MPKMVYARDLRAGDTLASGQVVRDLEHGAKYVFVTTDANVHLALLKIEVLRISRAD